MATCFGRIRAGVSGAITLAMVLFAPEASWSWGFMAHRVSSTIAESRLTPSALTAVRELLDSRTHLVDISTWADTQSEIPDSAPWHYVNVPISESRYLAKFCLPEGCVVKKIEDFKRVLLDPASSRTEKQLALKFLVHLIQDLHQPLHIGDTKSRGGNWIQVRFFQDGSNLHRAWDRDIIEWYSRDESLWLRDLNTLITPRSAIAWSKGGTEDWANESLSIAKTVYCLPGSKSIMRSGTRLGEEYCRFALPIIRRQLARAAVRTAAVLNSIFDPDGVEEKAKDAEPEN